MRIFQWLSEALGVQFDVDAKPCDSFVVDGWFGVGPEAESLILVSDRASPCMFYKGALPGETPATRNIRFEDSASTPEVFRGRQISQQLYDGIAGLEEPAMDLVIARVDERAVWATRTDRGWLTERVAFSLPEPKENEGLGDIFNQYNYARLLPLVDFARRISGKYNLSKQVISACFMFDDPNLHSCSYGFLNFNTLGREATKYAYHVAFATVPLDSWYFNAHVASHFAANRAKLSLLIHGNDHTRNELATLDDSQVRLASLAQALRRIDRFERASGVQVARVMAPPHGACSEDTLIDMGRLGYSGACVSHSSLRYWNPTARWRNTFILQATPLIGGLPIAPRFRISAGCQPAILLAAYLGQPIIPVGHHNDAREGLDLLAELAGFINTLPRIRWADMQAVFDENYWLSPGPVGDLVVGSRRVSLAVPHGYESIRVATAWTRMPSAEPIAVNLNQETLTFQSGSVTDSIYVREGDSLAVSVAVSNAIAPGSVPPPRRRLWPFLRRQIVECRDRLSPLRNFLKRSGGISATN